MSNIFGSNQLPEQEKESKAIQLYDEMKNKEFNELKMKFDYQMIKIIKKRLLNCTTVYEKILLNIIELLAQKGLQEQNLNYYFGNFKISGILDLVKNQIKNKIENEKKCSSEVQQLIRIYIKIMKGRAIETQMINICIKVLHQNIENLLYTINDLKLNNNERIMNKQESEEIEKELKQSTQLITVVSLIREQYPKSKYDWETRIPKQIIKILKASLYPLIHLNCPEYLNCTQSIIIQASPALQELKRTVFQALIEFSNNNYQIGIVLDQDINFLPHITPFIISFATSYKLSQEIIQDKQQQYQQQSEYSSSPLFISSSLRFIINQIMNNKCKLIIQIPNILHSLTLLHNYKYNLHINYEQDQQSQQIRQRIRKCLNSIKTYGDEQNLSELINVGYGRALIISVSTAGGTEEQGDMEIRDGLQQISDFFRDIHNGRNNNNNYPSFPPQPVLAKTCLEQIEEEGGNEEVESQIINKQKDFYINIKDQANRAKVGFLNFYINRRNTKRW